MNPNYYYLISLIFSLIFIPYTKPYIILPFKEIKEDEPYDFRDVEELLKEISFLNLYTELYIGTTPQRLPLIFKPNINYMAIIENTENQLISSDNYNPTKSDSLKSVNDKVNILFKDEVLSFAKETFHFLMTESDMSSIYSDSSKGKIDFNNYHSFSNIKFLCTNSKTKNYCGIFGLAYPTIGASNYNFIKELKEKSLIESSIWSVDFPDIDEDTFTNGNIIIGELPHIYNPKYYKENQYFTTKLYNKPTNDTSRIWQIGIDSATIIL